MQTLITFTAPQFKPTTDELDEESDAYINPGIFGKNLSDFLTEGLQTNGYTVSFRCAEDWGWYHEIEHDEPFNLTLGCQSDETGHLLQFHPEEPYTRKLFKKYHAQPKVELLIAKTLSILEKTDGITNIEFEDR